MGFVLQRIIIVQFINMRSMHNIHNNLQHLYYMHNWHLYYMHNLHKRIG